MNKTTDDNEVQLELEEIEEIIAPGLIGNHSETLLTDAAEKKAH